MKNYHGNQPYPHFQDEKSILMFTNTLLEICEPEEAIKFLDSLCTTLAYAQETITHTTGREMHILEAMKEYFWNLYKLQTQETYEAEKQKLSREFEQKLQSKTKTLKNLGLDRQGGKHLDN